MPMSIDPTASSYLLQSQLSSGSAMQETSDLASGITARANIQNAIRNATPNGRSIGNVMDPRAVRAANTVATSASGPLAGLASTAGSTEATLTPAEINGRIAASYLQAIFEATKAVGGATQPGQIR